MAAQNKTSAPAHNNKKRRKKKARKQHRVASTIMTFLLSVFLIIGLTGCMVVFSVFSDLGLFESLYSTFGIEAASTSDDVAGVDYIDLNELIQNQSQTTIIYAYDSDGKEMEIARLHGTENRIWVSLDETSKHLQNAYIALEDARFKEHQGVDWVRTIGGVIASKFEQGGSSITQQLIKNLTGENGRTFIRKYNEIKNALK
ncbi:MAG: transglycosylase domain-containing protein, partial [Clostridia bacterium]|nr:transglycosylase domain-containing protein [Clostridia bacterium]